MHSLPSYARQSVLYASVPLTQADIDNKDAVQLVLYASVPLPQAEIDKKGVCTCCVHLLLSYAGQPVLYIYAYVLLNTRDVHIRNNQRNTVYLIF